MILTKQGGFIVKPISILFGYVFDFIYNVMCSVGVVNIGVAIIIFTLFARLLMFPMMLQQSKSSKIMAYIQPELSKIQKKYKGKKDQESLIAQQRETREIQSKYGVSMSTGCITALIQLPIFLAVYRIISNIPAYVTKIYDLYDKIASPIMNSETAKTALTSFVQDSNNSGMFARITLDYSDKNTVIDVLAKFTGDAWDKFSALLTSADANVINAISTTAPEINERYNFFGINLTSIPGLALTTALIIPILSFVFQFLSLKVSPTSTPTATGDATADATMKSMKTMMYVMPVMSFFVTVSVPSGIGLYWAMGSLVSVLTTLLINLYFKHADMDAILKKSMEKAEIKRAKHPDRKSFLEKMQEASSGAEQQQQAYQQKKTTKSMSTQSLKNYTSSTMKKNEEGVKYREGSLAARANMLNRYDDNNGGNDGV